MIEFENTEDTMRDWHKEFKAFEREMRKVRKISERKARALRNPIRVKYESSNRTS